MNMITDPALAAFESLMRLREGCETTVYLDTLDHATVGIGHLVIPADNLKVGDTIPQTRVNALFAVDGAAALQAARAQMAVAGITSEAFVPYLASVCFQLGVRWTKGFPATWKLICEGEYWDAAFYLDESEWEDETPVRVKDFQDALRALPASPEPEVVA